MKVKDGLGARIVDKFIDIFHLDKGNKIKNYGYFEGILSSTINILLFILKFVMGTALNSISLKADAFNNLMDVITSIMVIVVFAISAKPADAEHPYGHGRAERIFSILIAAIIVFVGMEFFLSSFDRFINPIPIGASIFSIILLSFSILAKEFLATISLNLGKRINSASLKADAWNHRSDAIATTLVVVAFIFFRFGVYRLDGILGMAVSVLIAYTGISIILESSSALMGQATNPDLVKKITSVAGSFDCVKDVHHIHVHDYGDKFEITLHIRLEDTMHLNDVHSHVSEIERAIREIIPGAEVTVHAEPVFEE